MSTITTINGTDLVSDSREVINTNFSNLNTDKAETASPTFTWTITTPLVKITGGVPWVGKVLTSNAIGEATWEASAGGGWSQTEPLQDYAGTAIIGVLGTYVFDSAKTGSKYSITVDSIPVGSNLIFELRKNSYTTGNILSSVLQVATTDTLTNGKKTVSITDTDSFVAGDYIVAYLTSVGSTTPALNPYFTFTVS